MIKIAKILSLIALVFCVVISSTAFWAFSFVFGEAWSDAGIYASIIAISASIQFVVSPFGIVFPALDRIKIGSFWQMLLFVSICSLYFAKGLSPLSFFIAYIGIESVMYLIYFVIIIKITKNYDENINKQLL